jgi:Uma2 family endonuclease
MASMANRLVTADELLRVPRGRQRCELVRGQLHTMSPAGPRHGKVAARFAKLLMNHVDLHRLGDVYGTDTGFLVERGPDTVRAPDVAFVVASRTHLVPEQGWFPGPPDLAVEVRSPGDAPAEQRTKALEWLAHGCQLAVVVDPGLRRVSVYRPGAPAEELGEGDTFTPGGLVPGFTLRIADLFAP